MLLCCCCCCCCDGVVPHKMGVVGSVVSPSRSHNTADSFGREGGGPGPATSCCSSAASFLCFPPVTARQSWDVVTTQCNVPSPSPSPSSPPSRAADLGPGPPSRSRDSNCVAHYKSVSQCELPTPNGISSRLHQIFPDLSMSSV